MKRTLALIAVPLLMGASPAPPSAADVGPTPDYSQAVATTEREIRARLIDPDSARIEWPYGFSPGSLKGLFTKRYVGWFTCGTINARNRMGGYTGRSYFEVMIKGDAVTMLDIGDAGEVDPVQMSCERLVKDGSIKAVDLAATAGQTAQAAASQGGIGITLTASQAGPIIIAVAPGSKAEAAGLKVGGIIESVNGAAVKALSPAVTATLIRAQAGRLVISIVGAGDVVVNR